MCQGGRFADGLSEKVWGGDGGVGRGLSSNYFVKVKIRGRKKDKGFSPIFITQLQKGRSFC